MLSCFHKNSVVDTETPVSFSTFMRFAKLGTKVNKPSKQYWSNVLNFTDESQKEMSGSYSPFPPKIYIFCINKMNLFNIILE